MNSLTLLLSLMFLVACGKDATKSANNTQAQDSVKPVSSESFYYNLPAPDLAVNSVSYSGIIRQQRESNTHFCRRFQNVRAASYDFVCYQAVSSGSQAQRSFNNLTRSYGAYSISIDNFVGSAFIDEITDGSMYGGGNLLCQKLIPQNPSAGSSYQCFQKI